MADGRNKMHAIRPIVTVAWRTLIACVNTAHSVTLSLCYCLRICLCAGENKAECDHCLDNPNRMCKHCACCVCGDKREPDKQLMCDECDAAYHLYCLQPPLMEIPDVDEWSVCLSVCCITFTQSEPYCHSILFVSLSVGHSATYSLLQLIDHNQIWSAGIYLSSDPCKPFWIPCLAHFRCQREKYAKFRL